MEKLCLSYTRKERLEANFIIQDNDVVKALHFKGACGLAILNKKHSFELSSSATLRATLNSCCSAPRRSTAVEISPGAY